MKPYYNLAPVECTVRLKDYKKRQELIGKFMLCMILGRSTHMTAYLKHGVFKTKLDAQLYLDELHNHFYSVQKVSDTWPEDICYDEMSNE